MGCIVHVMIAYDLYAAWVLPQLEKNLVPIAIHMYLYNGSYLGSDGHLLKPKAENMFTT